MKDYRVFIGLCCLLLSVLSPLVMADKSVLVLFPIEVDEEDAKYEEDFSSALQEGLQARYTVFYGPTVETELEKEYAKVDCDAERCAQNVAIAFNGELIADASAKRLGDGYLLKLVIRNVISGKIIETKTFPCRGCDGFAVLEQLKEIGLGQNEENIAPVKASPGSGKIAASVNNNSGDWSASSSGQQVVLITASWDQYSKKQRQYLLDKNIAFQEYDADKTEIGKLYKERYKIRAYPATIINGLLVYGYSPEKTQKALLDVKSRKEVIFLTASWATLSKTQRKYFIENKIAFKEYDVDKTSQGRGYVEKMNIKIFPATLIDGELIQGYRKEMFQSLFNNRK